MKTFTINKVVYRALPIDFNFFCELEDRGIEMEDIDKKTFKCAREYLSLCGDMPSEQAGKEIEAHVVGGGNLNELITIFFEELTEADFFLAATKQVAEQTTAETEEPTQEPAPEKKRTARK